MIEAHHTAWAEWVFRRYLDSLLRRHFHSLRLLGRRPDVDANAPLLLLPNHSTWWDGFFVHYLNRRLFGRRLYLMMLEDQLRRNRFFAKVGAYSIDPGHTRETTRALRYTLSLLAPEQRGRNLVCIYPQGVLLPWGTRPLGLQEGVSWISGRHAGPVTLLPLGIRVEMLADQRPDVFFRFGDPIRTSEFRAVDTSVLENAMTATLDQMESEITAGEIGSLLMAGSRSINERFEALRRRLGLSPGRSA